MNKKEIRLLVSMLVALVIVVGAAAAIVLRPRDARGGNEAAQGVTEIQVLGTEPQALFDTPALQEARQALEAEKAVYQAKLGEYTSLKEIYDQGMGMLDTQALQGYEAAKDAFEMAKEKLAAAELNFDSAEAAVNAAKSAIRQASSVLDRGDLLGIKNAIAALSDYIPLQAEDFTLSGLRSIVARAEKALQENEKALMEARLELENGLKDVASGQQTLDSLSKAIAEELQKEIDLQEIARQLALDKNVLDSLLEKIKEMEKALS